ncbi:hypothetical protein [Pseudomonas putida]|uniref:hypothetical protein n=1 Tax=Pseudomonas putida TaxID=303 RepID=UPI003734FB46
MSDKSIFSEANATSLADKENQQTELKAVQLQYSLCMLEKTKLEQELEATRATSVERKNSLKKAHDELAENALIIQSLRHEAGIREAQQANLQKKLHMLEGQLELLADLVRRA